MKAKRLGIIVQARMGSSRFPGKVLKPFYDGQSIVEIIVSRIKEAFPHEKLILATSKALSDDALVKLCERMNVAVFRGEEQDVLQRFIDLGEENDFHAMVRVCGDNPFLHIGYLGSLIDFYYQNDHFDYISYHDYKNMPSIKTHWGLFTEIVKLEALKKVNELTSDFVFHDHVTNFIYSHVEQFNVRLLEAPVEIYYREDLRFTIDTKEDFENNKLLFGETQVDGIYKSLKRLIDYVDENPKYLKVMRLQIASTVK